MDVKYVLGSILREAEALGGSGELRAGVRLTGAVNGERGEGYWLLFEEKLVLLYRQLGQRDYLGCGGELWEYSFENYREEKYALMVRLICRGNGYECEFTPSERASAEIILNAVSSAAALPETVYSENILIMAGVIFALSGSGHTAYAEKLLGKELFRTGKRYTGSHPLPELLERANTLWNADQKKSVLLNLIEQRMSDDLFDSEESAALRDLAALWDLGEEFYSSAKELLLLKKNIGGLFENN